MYVKYRQELKVQKALTDQDILSFIPMTEVLGRRNGVDQRNVVPAIHNLIFIYSSQERITWMKMHNEVCTRMQYMSFRNNSDNTSTIITVPENQMQNIIKAATVKDPAGLRTYEDAPKQSPFAKPDREIEFVRLYGVMNGGKVTCQPRFRKIVTLNDGSGFFAAGIYKGLYNQDPVEYSSLIDRKGVDLKLRLFRDVQWLDGYFYSCYSLGRGYYFNYWDPKGKCYYDDDPEFQKVAGVEIAFTREHTDRQQACMKLRYTTGKVSPRFYESEVFYNRYVIVARDYLVVKKDHNHAYQIKGFLPDSILVQSEEQYGYQQFFTDGRKGQYFRSLPADAKRSIFQVWQLGLKRL